MPTLKSPVSRITKHSLNSHYKNNKGDRQIKINIQGKNGKIEKPHQRTKNRKKK